MKRNKETVKKLDKLTLAHTLILIQDLIEYKSISDSEDFSDFSLSSSM